MNGQQKLTKQKILSVRQAAAVYNTDSKSMAASNNASNNASELLALFECPVCFDYALPPIFQCESGHVVCTECRAHLHICPSCRAPLANIRNLALEKVAEQVLFPCKFSSSGCQLTMSSATKPAHELHCDYRPYVCPCPGSSCKWSGSVNDVMSHLLSQHNAITTLQGEDIVFMATDVSLPGNVDWVMLQSCFDSHFLLVLEKQDKQEAGQMFYAVVQYIGTNKQAQNFVYRLELRKGRRRLAWEGSPHSIQAGVQLAINASDCLIFDGRTANMFADNSNLAINVTMSPC